MHTKPIRWSLSIALSGLEEGIAWDCALGRRYEEGCTNPLWPGMTLMAASGGPIPKVGSSTLNGLRLSYGRFPK